MRGRKHEGSDKWVQQIESNETELSNALTTAIAKDCLVLEIQVENED